MKRLIAVLTLLPFAANAADLLYFEAQGIAGWSSAENKAVYHSASKHDVMQKNSIGFDWLHKFSGQSGDWASAALQMRLAYNDSDHDFTPQVYNAWFKIKTRAGDVWAGHNRIAFGLASYWDTHADLLGDMPMQGVGFDRDWGAGWSMDTADGNLSASITTGSGMPLRTYGNKIFAARAAKGVLNYDNYTAGLSVMAGKTLDTMGYKIMNRSPKNQWLIGFDGALNSNNLEHKAELDAGQYDNEPFYAALYRLTVKWDAEERLATEAQAAYVNKAKTENYTAGGAVAYKLTGDLTARLMVQHRSENAENVYMGQLYWYFPM